MQSFLRKLSKAYKIHNLKPKSPPTPAYHALRFQRSLSHIFPMSESHSHSHDNNNSTNNVNFDVNNVFVPSIPVEIITQDEMALIEAAMALASSTRSALLQRHGRSIVNAVNICSKSGDGGGNERDIEDLGKEKNVCEGGSLLQKFRKKRALSVTDLIAAEWCEKKMEFALLYGKRETTFAMKLGSARHAILEEEVVKKVNVHVETAEDTWAIKFLNFVAGANQLLFEGLTREVPLIGFVEGVWIAGVTDEIRMPKTGANNEPMLVETKTRVQDALPAEAQRRNGRLQLMCYKYLWDNIVSDEFPSEEFFTFFSLDPDRILSEEIRCSTDNSDLPAQTLGDVVRYYKNTCGVLPTAHDQLLLRYELQKDNSVIGEDQFVYDSDWVKSQMRRCLEFWQGEREAIYAPEQERWKCRFCQFAFRCPIFKP